MNIDVVIIYAERDEGFKEWVYSFRQILERILLQALDRKPVIACRSEDDKPAEVGEVGVMLAILSEELFASDQCMGWVQKFIKQNPGPQRAYKILPTRIPLEEQPEELRHLPEVALYSNRNNNRFPEQIDFDGHQELWLKMVNLTGDIEDSLRLVKTGSTADHKSTSQKSVFLAVTTEDLNLQRDMIRRELKREGYKVLPEGNLPPYLPDLKASIKKGIEESSFSIHLIGDTYGEIPAGYNRSIIDLQHQLAAEKCTKVRDKEKFIRLIWINPKLQHASEQHLSFVESIKRNISFAETAELLQTPLEDFKIMIREDFIKKKTKKKHVSPPNSGDKRIKIYLLHDQRDQKAILPIKTYFEDSGYHVLLPSFEGTVAEMKNNHITNLQVFDIAILFQQKAPDNWLQVKFFDLLKAPGFGRKKAIKAKIIMSANNQAAENETLKNYNISFINSSKDPVPDLIDVFKGLNLHSIAV